LPTSADVAFENSLSDTGHQYFRVLRRLLWNLAIADIYGKPAEQEMIS
jgi:hypothetical protein